MSRTLELLAIDPELAGLARPDLDEAALIREALARGSVLLGPNAERPPAGSDPVEHGLRVDLAEAVAEVAWLRWSLVTNRDRFGRARDTEQRSYVEHLELEREIVPPLKMEARRLRRELRRLEAEASEHGVDVSVIEPQIDWPGTIAVDGYEHPRYETNESRRQAAIEFFRRVRPE